MVPYVLNLTLFGISVSVYPIAALADVVLLADLQCADLAAKTLWAKIIHYDSSIVIATVVSLRVFGHNGTSTSHALVGY